jgi:hypothetical protein
VQPPPLNVPFELTPAEREVITAARAGRMAVLSDRAGPPDREAAVAEGDGPVVRAEVLAALCTDDDAQVHRRGVQVRGAVVEGDLDLRWTQLRCPLRLEHCWIPGGVLLADADGKELVLDHCTLKEGIQASRLRLDGCLSLVGTIARGRVAVDHARIGGDLDCAGAHLVVPGDVALLADGASVDADVLLGGLDRNEDVVRDASGQALRFEADGAVRLLGATISGQLSCRGGRFMNKGGSALAADRAKVTGGVLLDRALGGGGQPVAGPDGAPLRFEADGEVRLHGATIGGQLSCSGARFTSEGGTGLAADGANVTGGVFFGAALDGRGQPVAGPDGAPLGFEADGEVRLHGATIGGEQSCSGPRLTSQCGTGLDADAANGTDGVCVDLSIASHM